MSTLDISYGQLAVFQSALQQPFNAWTDAHVAQGFAWRPGSVAFATLEPAGSIEVEVVHASDLRRSTATRIIAVPFSVDHTGAVEIASISDSEPLALPPGEYRLTFAHGLTASGAMWCRLSFELASTPAHAEILRADGALSAPSPLVMQATPA